MLLFLRRNFMNRTIKLISIILIILTLLVQFSSTIFAVTEMSTADITYDKDCGDYLKARDDEDDEDAHWYTILTSYVEYEAPNRNKVSSILLR